MELCPVTKRQHLRAIRLQSNTVEEFCIVCKRTLEDREITDQSQIVNHPQIEVR